PIMTLVPLFGGVTPDMIIGGYAVIFAALISLGALSLYCSVVSATAVQATAKAYAAAVAYLLLCPCLLGLVFRSDMVLTGSAVFVAANVIFACVLVTVSIHDLRPRAELLPPPPPLPANPSPRPPPRSGEGEQSRLPLPASGRGPGGGVLGDSADDLPFLLPADAPSPAPVV